MSIYFRRKKEINVITTQAPARKISVGAYPVALHFDFPFKLAIYKDPCKGGFWTVCEYYSGMHISVRGDTRKEIVKAAIRKVNKFFEQSSLTPSEFLMRKRRINK